VVRLTEVFRQAAASRIIVNAHRINAGEIPDLRKPEGDSDFYFVPADDPETAVPRIIELIQTRIPGRFGFNSVRDIQVLCPMNRGGVGARSLNIELQKALNRVTDRKVERFGWTFAAGDKVMQIVDPEGSELIAIFDGRAVTYGFGELDGLVLAYAATIHKSQGSEYPVNPSDDAALHDVAEEPALHRRHPRQTAGRAGGTEEGSCHSRTERIWTPALVETERVAEGLHKPTHSLRLR
jgi:exodeoxyribonuclease V alpha subunit